MAILLQGPISTADGCLVYEFAYYTAALEKRHELLHQLQSHQENITKPINELLLAKIIKAFYNAPFEEAELITKIYTQILEETNDPKQWDGMVQLSIKVYEQMKKQKIVA